LEGGFFADGVAEDGLDVLVAALVGLPVMVAEGFVDCMDVELVEESLVSVCFFGGGLRCHCMRICV
jgi:hypothetical protein